MWPNADETQELLAAVRRGESQAANRLFERHRESLRRMVEMRLDPALRRRVDASDVVQEALLDANRRIKQYLGSEPLPFHLWLRQIARDRVIDAHRRHRKAGRRSVDREQSPGGAAFGDQSSLDLAAQLRDPELTPAAEAIRRELETRFHAALDKLADADREVLLMRHFEHLTNQEAAQSLGLSEAAAGMRYLRALRRLRALLSEPPRADGTT